LARDWATGIAEFLLNKIVEADFVAAANSPDTEKDRGQHCEAWYYSGMKRLLAGDKKTAANYFRKCLATRESNFDEYIFAQAELKRIGPTK
jgi:lipoprotein NlpI